MKLTKKHASLLLLGVKHAGTYDPGFALSSVEESMTLAEAKSSHEFLTWCVANDRKFAASTLPVVWLDWRNSLAGKKAIVSKCNGHDRLVVVAKFPTGGLLRLTVSRSGDTLTFGGSTDHYQYQRQKKAMVKFTASLPGENHGARMERIAALAKQCLSIDDLTRRIEAIK